jgi:hypothetical protein
MIIGANVADCRDADELGRFAHAAYELTQINMDNPANA